MEMPRWALGIEGRLPVRSPNVIVPFCCGLPKKICRRCGPKQYILAVRHWPCTAARF